MTATFNEILQDMVVTVSHPTAATEGDVIYTDPIGEFMKVTSVDKLMLYGETYDINDEGNGSYSVLAKEDNPGGRLVNESYGSVDTGDSGFFLADINIWTTTDPAGQQTLHVLIPRNALPLKLNEDSGIDSKYSNPFRLIYTVGLDEEAIYKDKFFEWANQKQEQNDGHYEKLVFIRTKYISIPMHQRGTRTMGWPRPPLCRILRQIITIKVMASTFRAIKRQILKMCLRKRLTLYIIQKKVMVE